MAQGYTIYASQIDPVFRANSDRTNIQANNITNLLTDKLERLEIVDSIKTDQDRLTLEIKHTNPPINPNLLRNGLAVYLWEDKVTSRQLTTHKVSRVTVPFGYYIVDNVEVSGPRSVMKVMATGADQSRGMQIPKSKSWGRTTFIEILSELSALYGLQPETSGSLQGISFENLQQTNTSDVDFLERLAGENNFHLHIKSGYILFLPKNQGVNANQDVITTFLPSRQISSFKSTFSIANRVTGIRVKFLDSSNQVKTLLYGGPPFINELPKQFNSLNEAFRAAQSEYLRFWTETGKLLIQMPLDIRFKSGTLLELDPNIFHFNERSATQVVGERLRGETLTRLENFLYVRIDSDTQNALADLSKWFIIKTTHQITGSSSMTSVECRLPQPEELKLNVSTPAVE